jgi:hypothetical protein
MDTLQLFHSYQTTPKYCISDGGIVVDNRQQQSPGLNESRNGHKLLYNKHGHLSLYSTFAELISVCHEDRSASAAHTQHLHGMWC